MRTHEDILAMVTVLKASHNGLLDRYEHITGIAVGERSPEDRAFMIGGGGVRECRAIESELNALEWVLEKC